jgi:hypothetical protein
MSQKAYKKHLKITWSKPYEKSSEGAITSVVEDIKVTFIKGGTLLMPQEDVEVLTSFRYDHNGKSKTAIRKVYGDEVSVYQKMVKDYGSNEREMFMKKFAHAKAKFNYEYGEIFKRASSNRFFDEIYNQGMNPEKFKKQTNVDGSVLFREIKGDRKLSLDKAIEYAKQLKCDPVDLLFEKQMCSLWGQVDLFGMNTLDEDYFPGQIMPNKEEMVECPRDIFRAGITAIRINSIGSHLHGHYAYYYKKDVADNSLNDRLCVVGTVHDDFEQYGLNTHRYWFGIFKVEKGVQKLINPEPEAEKKVLITGPFDFVAPVAAVVRPSAMKRDYDYYESMNAAKELFVHQAKLQEMNFKLSQMLREQKYKEEIKSDYFQKEKSKIEQQAIKEMENKLLKYIQDIKKENDKIPEHLKKKLA